MSDIIDPAATMNRRSALAKLGMGLAASTSLAATAIAAPAGVSPELLRLIEEHRVAKADDLRTSSPGGQGNPPGLLGDKARSAPGFMDMYAERPRDCPGERRTAAGHGRWVAKNGKDRVVRNLVVHRTVFAGKKASSIRTHRRSGRSKSMRQDKAIEKESLAAIDAYFDKDEAAREIGRDGGGFD